MTPQQREKNRLRSQAWRRARGIMPRRPAQRPWEAMGISRSTWYRRGNRIAAKPSRFGTLSRAESLAAALARDLARCAVAHAVMARELARL